MAYTTIQGQNALGTRKPTNLKAAFGTDLMAPEGAPEGIGVSVEGMLANSSPGMYGLVLGFSTPASMSVDVKQSGSWRSRGSSNYDMMRVVVSSDVSVRSAQTEYWEVWFKDSDVKGDDWSTEVSMNVGTDQYTYVFTKKRVGDGLDEDVTEAKLEPSVYDRKGE